VKAGTLKSLMDFDELNMAKRDGRAFVEYSEGKIDFPPTYKYILGTDDLDLTEDLVKRSPAYTDRIFFRHEEAKMGVEIHHYTLGKLSESDHKPISCFFTIARK